LPQRAGTLLAGLAEHEGGVALGTSSSRITDTSELRIEVVFGHATRLELA
jgi:hypothetical protein